MVTSAVFGTVINLDTVALQTPSKQICKKKYYQKVENLRKKIILLGINC